MKTLEKIWELFYSALLHDRYIVLLFQLNGYLCFANTLSLYCLAKK